MISRELEVTTVASDVNPDTALQKIVILCNVNSQPTIARSHIGKLEPTLIRYDFTGHLVNTTFPVSTVCWPLCSAKSYATTAAPKEGETTSRRCLDYRQKDSFLSQSLEVQPCLKTRCK